MIFLTALLDKALEKLPWVARIPFYLGVALMWIVVWAFNWGMEIPTKAQSWFDTNYERNTAPKGALLESRLLRIEENTKETRQDIREIRNHLLGGRNK